MFDAEGACSGMDRRIGFGIDLTGALAGGAWGIAYAVTGGADVVEDQQTFFFSRTAARRAGDSARSFADRTFHPSIVEGVETANVGVSGWDFLLKRTARGRGWEVQYRVRPRQGLRLRGSKGSRRA